MCHIFTAIKFRRFPTTEGTFKVIKVIANGNTAHHM